jgi:eukaryotic-like serine/threonine-protein kinase
MNGPANVFQQIQSICREFRRNLKRGDAQGIESYLDKVDASARENLFQNLLMIDLDLRRQRDESPAAEEYLSRFPNFSSIVRQTFMEDLTASLNPAAGSPADMPTVVHRLADNRQLGDYELLQELGRGGFGVVYKARHQQRNDLVALKILPSQVEGQSLPTSAADRLHKFRREFRSLSNINHPNLIGMQTLECDDDQWFFTMDLIDGVSFRDYVRPGGELNEERLRHAAKQLVEGVLALHEQGIVHRDLKPSNVLVDAGGHLTILDFGLIAELQQRTDQTASMRSAQFGGTPLYAAPEQAMGERTAASDWYALGVMLYEALTGSTPFSGSNNIALVVKKQNEDAPLLSGSLDGPTDLATLVDRLLQRDPQQRPDSATISAALGAGDKSSHSDATGDDSCGLTQSPEYELIGRRTQLQQLSDCLSDVMETGRPVITFVSGRSGEGKTSLVEKFLDPLRLGRDVLVLSGRCYDRESVPFKAVDTMIDAIVAFLRSRSDDDVVKVLPDDIRMLAHLFPIMRRVGSVADRTTQPFQGLDDRQIRYRAFFALRDLLSSISNTTPVVMFIDDLQWGDGDSATVLFELLSPPTPPTVLFLGTYRSDEAADSPFLKEWNRLNTERTDNCKAQKIEVGPLTEDECLELVAGRIGIDSNQIRGQITDLFQDTGGNPYFLEQLIEGFDADSGRFRAVPLHEIIAQKLNRLPAEASVLLDAIAVSGSAASLDEVSTVARHETPLYSTVTHMRSERLVRLIGSGEQQLVDTYHDKIRETVLSRMSKVVRQEYHHAIGVTIESNNDVDSACVTSAVFHHPTNGQELLKLSRAHDLAYHFDMAGDSRRATSYATLAAEHAGRQFAHEMAVSIYQIARRNAPRDHPGLTFRICSGFGASLVRLARHEQAMKVLREALESVSDPIDKLSVEALMAESEYRHGDLVCGVKDLERILRDLGVRVPRSQRAALASATVKMVDRFVLTKIRSFLAGRRPHDKQSMLIFKILQLLPYIYFYSGTPKCVWACFTVAARAERYELTSISVNSIEHCANALMVLGMRTAAERHYKAAIRCADEHDDLAAKLNVLRLRGLQLLVVGRPALALESLELPRAMYEQKLPDSHRLANTLYWVAKAHHMLGNLLDAAVTCAKAFRHTTTMGMHRVAGNVLETWTRTVEGRVRFRELRARIEAPTDPATIIQLEGAEVYWHLANARVASAVEIADRAFANFRTTWPMITQTAFIVATAARAFREYAQSVSDTDSEQARVLRKRALWSARWGLLRIQFMRCEHPALLREYALASSAFDRPRRAYRAARKSCHIAEEQQAKHEYAKSLLVCGQIGEKLGKPEARRQIEEAEGKLADFDRQIEEANRKAMEYLGLDQKPAHDAPAAPARESCREVSDSDATSSRNAEREGSS